MTRQQADPNHMGCAGSHEIFRKDGSHKRTTASRCRKSEVTHYQVIEDARRPDYAVRLCYCAYHAAQFPAGVLQALEVA